MRFHHNTSHIFFLLGLLLLIALPVGAQTKKQLEREKQQIEQQIKKLNAELDAAKKNTKSSSAQLNVLNKKIQERTRLINNINSQMQLLDRQIGHTQDSIAQLQIQIDSLKHEYGNIIRVLYAERNRLSGEVFMMDADSYNRAFLRRKYFQEYSRYRKLQAAAIRQREDEMQTINNALQRQKNEKNNLLSQEQNQKNALAREKQQQQRQLTQSQQREKNLKAQLSKKEKERIKLQQQIQKIINEEIAKARRAAEAEKKAREQAARNAKNAKNNKSAEKPKSTATDALSSNFASNKGKLSWPVYYKKVSREYGRYTHESGGENMNNGIDLITASGADVFAIFNGTVSRVFTCPNGTKGIIVRHGDYMTVYANLGSVAVSEGKQVSTKQKLGTVHPGTDGTSEFSFQIWKSTQSQNPRNWLR